MRKLRITILAAFAASVIVTALALFVLPHLHALHIAHQVLAVTTFLLLAVYLRKSAVLASSATLRELRERLAADEKLAVGELVTVPRNSVLRCGGIITDGETLVDESPLSGRRGLVRKTAGDAVYRGSINHNGAVTVRVSAPVRYVCDAAPQGQPDFNVCVGALAKSGIYVKSPAVLLALARAKTLAPLGNSPERDGYSAARDSLAKMGVELSGDTSDVTIKLCDFREFDESADVVITHNKVTHVLKAVYVARVYAKARPHGFVRAAVTIAAVITLCALRQFMFAAMAAAFSEVPDVLGVRRLEKSVSKLSFEKVTSR